MSAAPKMTHPLTRAFYERQDDGLVRVEDVDGQVGLFHPDGRWHSGELRFADPQACNFVGRRRPRRPT